MKAKTVERKIHFYKIIFVKELDNVTNQEVNPANVFEYINRLPFATGERYQFIVDDALFLKVDSIDSETINGSINISRRSNLPSLEKEGETEPLDIPEDSGLCETTHFCIFGSNVLGMEFNFYGPRINRLCDHVKYLAGELVDNIDLILLINEDVAETLRNIGEIKLLKLRVREPASMLFRDLHEPLATAIEHLEEITDADDVEIILRKKGRGKYFQNLRQLIGALPTFLGRLDVREATDLFKIMGRNIITNKNQEFDLLEDKLIAAKKVIQPNKKFRSVDKNSMYEAIVESYKELRPMIERTLEQNEK